MAFSNEIICERCLKKTADYKTIEVSMPISRHSKIKTYLGEMNICNECYIEYRELVNKWRKQYI